MFVKVKSFYIPTSDLQSNVALWMLTAELANTIKSLVEGSKLQLRGYACHIDQINIDDIMKSGKKIQEIVKENSQITFKKVDDQ